MNVVANQEAFIKWVTSTGLTAVVEDLGETAPSITLHAPKGKVFAQSLTHQNATISCVTPNGAISWARAQRMTEAFLKQGMKPCPQKDECPVCRDRPETAPQPPRGGLLKNLFTYLRN